MNPRLRNLVFPALCLIASCLSLHANISSDAVVDLQAAVSDSSPCITLSWTQHLQSNITKQVLYRRLKGSNSWGAELATLTNTQTSYADTTASPNVEYEYWMKRTFNASPYTAIGYISAGDKVPEVHARGTLLLVVDDTMVTPLATEIAQLRDDLAADGWTVQQINAPRTGTAISTKALIKAAYDADPANVKMVYILGRVPVPYSGFIGPDGHGSRAWPTDGYYADMDGVWTDTQTFSGSITGARGANVPGDGKFDQHSYPSTLELQVGRVDMANMKQAPTSGTSETTLLRRYLRKAHDFRFKQGAYAAIPRRSLMREGFVNWAEAFAANGWATAYTCVSPSTAAPKAVDEAPADQWFTYATANSYLTGHINGSGGSTSFQNGGISIEFGRKPSKVVFPSAFGSYSGDWDYENAAMRTILAGNATGDSLGLTCYWTGRPHYFTHHLGMGETYGYAIRASQNANIAGGGGYMPGGTGFGQVLVGLMGDPALRMHMVEPPRNLVATSANGQVTLSWAASTETALQGYHVYRATTSAGPFTRLTTTPQADITYTDTTASANQSYAYMVRTLKLETPPSGSYYNLSHGSLITLTVNSAATAAPLNPTNVAVGQDGNGKLKLTWTDNATNESGYTIERKSTSNGSYASQGTVAANVTTFTDSEPPVAGTTYYYRVYANGTPQSAYSNEAFLEASAGTFDFQTVTLKKVDKTAGSVLIPVERFGGVTGAATVTYTTADSSAVSGTHFTGGTGTVSWAAGEGGVKNVSIPITNTAAPQQARQFRVNLSGSTGADIGQYNTMAVLIEDPGSSLPSPWSQAILDNANATVSDKSPAVLAEGAIGSVTVGGYGLDANQTTWETGQFIYQSRTGDGVMTACIPTPVPAQTAARFAVMARDTINWQSKMVATVVTGDSAQGSRFIYRSAANANGVLTPSTTNSLTTPRWIRLIRAGDAFTSQVSVDGTAWTTLGSATVSLAATTNWGLFHISTGLDYNRQPFGNYQLATFENVTLGNLPVPDAPTGLTVGATTATTVPLTWNVSPFAAGYRIERRGEDGVVVQIADIAAGGTVSYSDTTVEADSAYEYRIRAYNSVGENASADFVRAVTPPADITTILTTDDAGSADAGVQYDNASTSYGAAATLPITASDYYVNYTDTYTHVAKAWLRFNLGSLPAPKSAKLKLACAGQQNMQAVFDSGGYYSLDIRLLADASDSWDESLINWTNAPQNNVANHSVTGMSQVLAVGNYYDIGLVPADNSVVSFNLSVNSINANRGANNLLTLAIVPSPYAYYGGTVIWASREHATLPPPTLELVSDPIQQQRPGFLSVSPGAGGGMNLTWFDGALNESGFQIERRVANGPWTPLATCPANTTSHADTTALPGVIYEYRVRATSATLGSSSWVLPPSRPIPHTGDAALSGAVSSADGVVFKHADTSADHAYVPTGFTYTLPPVPLVTGQTLSTISRNNYSGWVGMKLTVGAVPITVGELGRWVLAGNSGSHIVKLVNASNNADLGSVNVNTAGAPVGFKYAGLAAPVTLAANTTYYLVSRETSGGDAFYEGDTALTTTGAATINQAVWSANGGAYSVSYLAGNGYVPLSFTYSAVPVPFVSGHSMTTLRNDFSGWLGMEITTGATPLTVGELGRWVAPGNSGIHTVKLVNAGNGATIGSVSVATAGAPSGQFKYAPLASAVTLAPDTTYYVLSQETAGGDQWYDFGMAASGSATGYQYWLLANGLPMDASGSGDATATPANDSLPNLVKYALGLTPTTIGNAGRLGYGATTVAGSNYLTFTYIRPDPAPAGISYSIEASSDLVSADWSASGLTEINNTANNGLRTVTVRDNVPIGGFNTRFMRLKVTES